MSTNLPVPEFSSQAPLNLDFEGVRVRFVGTADVPEWVAHDIGMVFGIDNVRQAIADFDEDEKGVCKIYTIRGMQSVATLYEPGLYRLVFKSRKPEAVRFRK